MEQEVKLCDEVETVSEFTYLGDRVSAGVGFEAAVTAIIRYGELLHTRFPLKLKEVAYKSHIRPAILYGSEAWWLKESEMDRKIHGESNVWSTAQRQKQIYGFDVYAGLEGNHRSVGSGKQCSLLWSCVEERGWSHLKKGVKFWGWWSKQDG